MTSGTSLLVQSDALDLSFDHHLLVLEDISFSVEQGEFVSILGPSGCGKSSLLRVISGLIKPTGGQLTAPDRDIGFVFQKPALLPWATVRENAGLAFRLGAAQPSERRTSVDDLLDLVGLSHAADQKPHTLSGGMQMRVSIARALAGRPKLLLMDEPFAALDTFTRQQLNDDLIRIWQELGTTTVFVTHAIDEAAYLSNTILLMSTRPGRIIARINVPFPRPRLPNLKRNHDFVDFCASVERQLKESMEASA